MNPELRLTETNAATDSSGRTWGLEGNLFWWLIGGLGLGITVFFLMVVGFKAGIFLSLGIAILPVILCLAYIFGLRQGKPPGYDRDIIERTLTHNGFGPESASVHHPFEEDHE